MNLNPDQFIGSVCEGLHDGYLGAGIQCYWASGVFLARQGQFRGNGTIHAEPNNEVFRRHTLATGDGFFRASGEWSGNAPGLIYLDPFTYYNNGGPPFTYSGTGRIYTFDYAEQSVALGVYSGRNEFHTTGLITGTLVTGHIVGSGELFLAGDFRLDSDLQPVWVSGVFSGCFEILDGTGAVYKTDIAAQEAVRCFTTGGGSFYTVGLFDSTGASIWHGTGAYYDQIGNDYGHVESEFTHWVYPVMSGEGKFAILNGVWTGYSPGLYYGYGVALGSNIFYASGEYAEYLEQEFWGIGDFMFTGRISAESGWYAGRGAVKGRGTFSGGSGIIRTLEGGPSNIWHHNIPGDPTNEIGIGGWGTMYLTDDTDAISGIFCDQPLPSSGIRLGCFPFPPFLNTCGVVGNIGLDFAFQGGCVSNQNGFGGGGGI